MCLLHILLYNHDKDVFNNEEGQELLRMMLLKDIRAGVGVSTANKVWPDLCLQVAYQRCQTK